MSVVENLRVVVTLDDGETFEVSAKDYLLSYEVVCELDSDIRGLRGLVSANEFVFALSNQDDRFTPANALSPYFGRLKAGVRVDIFVEQETLGSFFVASWDAKNTVTRRRVDVRCVDRLQSVLNNALGDFITQSNITLREYIRSLLVYLGFSDSDVVIHDSLSQIIDFTVFSGHNVATVLNEIALGADCYIFVDSANRVVVTPKAIVGEIKHLFSTDSTIVRLTDSKSLISEINTLKVSYSNHSISDVKRLLYLSNTVVAGLSKLENQRLESSNLYEVDNVKVMSSAGVVAEGVSCTQDSISIDFNNPSNQLADCIISVYGKTIQSSSAFVELTDVESVAKHGKKDLEVSSNIITTKDMASALANVLWGRITDSVPYLFVDLVESGFRYKLMDICRLGVDALNIDFTGFVHSVKYVWRGGDVVSVTIGVKK